jgi:autotransporter adhesin
MEHSPPVKAALPIPIEGVENGQHHQLKLSLASAQLADHLFDVSHRGDCRTRIAESGWRGTSHGAMTEGSHMDTATAAIATAQAPTLESRLTAVENTVTSIAGNVAVVASTLAAVTPTSNTFEQRIAAIENKIAEIASDVATFQAKHKKLTSVLQDLIGLAVKL